MAEVFRAVLDGPQGFSRTVVLKRILPNLAHDEGFLRLFLDEARISALLHHPSIVQVNDFGAIDGTYFLAMELVEGWTLGKLLQLCKQRLTAVPVADVCYAISELASALAYAHALTDESGRALEIVHRDVSPSNIMALPVAAPPTDEPAPKAPAPAIQATPIVEPPRNEPSQGEPPPRAPTRAPHKAVHRRAHGRSAMH
jgi:hypothetical protein